jgi:hypothetical protein
VEESSNYEMPHYVCIHMQIPTSYYGFLFSESM